MAFITIRNATVGSVSAKGFILIESYKTRDGEPIQKKYKVWSDEPVSENETLTVSGIFSAKIAEYNGVTYVEVNVNQPRIERGVGGGSRGEQVQSYNAIEDADAPF